MTKRLAPIPAIVLTLAVVTLAARAAQPTATAAVAAPPACAGIYLDRSTPFAAYTDWSRTLVDTIYAVPATYAPADLVATGLPGAGQIRSIAKTDLTAMANAAAGANAALGVASAYRSYADQVTTFDYWVRQSGLAAALGDSARPGHSEHQLGTVIDFRSANGGVPWNGTDWATTPAGAWMNAHAWEYGWVMSYPRALSPAQTCYTYEPWHYRYVGRTVAAAIHASGQSSRQYLWTAMAASDTSAPVTGILPLPAVTTSPSFSVGWTGHDVGWSGMASFDVDVSIDGAAYSRWITATTLRSGTYSGASGHTYAFRVRAQDVLGHVGAFGASNTYVATPAVAPGGFATIATGAVNVRAAPGTGGAILGTARRGDLVEVVAGPLTIGGLAWYEISLPVTTWPATADRLSGWVAAASGWLSAAHAPNTTRVP